MDGLLKVACLTVGGRIFTAHSAFAIGETQAKGDGFAAFPVASGFWAKLIEEQRQKRQRRSRSIMGERKNHR
jgi:hypothetical protein